jgi:hypothetical protein
VLPVHTGNRTLLPWFFSFNKWTNGHDELGDEILTGNQQISRTQRPMFIKFTLELIGLL